MAVTSEELDQIRMGALLHDIGKIGIADSVLQKPGSLTKEERTLLEQHPIIGRRILEGVNGFQAYLPAVELHHENWDGSGYPLGLRGQATPLSARIVHVADAYDAMTSDRPYRRGMSHEEAIRVLEQYAGTQFDASIVPVFTNLAGVARRARQPAGANSLEVRSLAEALNGGMAAAPQRTSEARNA